MANKTQLSQIGSLALAVALSGACATTQPKALSADEHLAQAEHHERKADEHEDNHHIEWTPTERSPSEVARYRAIAADHRAASEALRAAEARACRGIEEDDRDESPFVHPADIVAVQEINELDGKQQTPRRRGATVVLRAVPGLTAQWLQRLVDCRIAENAALGYQVPEFPHDPLAVPGGTARVSERNDGFAVDIVHESPDAAKLIQERAASLTSTSPESTGTAASTPNK